MVFAGQFTKNARMPRPEGRKFHAVLGASHVHGQSFHTEAVG